MHRCRIGHRTSGARPIAVAHRRGHIYNALAAGRAGAEYAMKIDPNLRQARLARAVELDRVGQETSAILQRAHESADEITRRSRTRAAARIEEAERQADELRREAEARLKRIDKDTDDVWADRRRLLEDARSMGEALIRLADEALERFPPAEDGGPPVEPPPRPPRPPVARAAEPEPAPIPEPEPEPELEPEPDTQLEEAPPPLSDEARVVDEGDPSIESVRRIPRPGAPTHPRRPRR